MSVVIAQNIALTQLEGGGANKPLIGWHDLVQRSNIRADIEDQYFPAINLTNPSTAQQWRSTAKTEQSLYVSFQSTELVDYIGIARHNLGSSGASVSVEVRSSDNPDEWRMVFTETILPDDSPAILRFEPVIALEVAVRIKPAFLPPRIGVLYAGRLTVMQHGMAQGVTALPYAYDTEVVTGQAESGDYLGRIVTGQSKSLSFEFEYISYKWFRQHLDGFAKASMVKPFFFAWLPQEFPRDCGFGWLESDIQPVTERFENELVVSFSLQIRAIAV